MVNNLNSYERRFSIGDQAIWYEQMLPEITHEVVIVKLLKRGYKIRLGGGEVKNVMEGYLLKTKYK